MEVNSILVSLIHGCHVSQVSLGESSVMSRERGGAVLPARTLVPSFSLLATGMVTADIRLIQMHRCTVLLCIRFLFI